MPLPDRLARINRRVTNPAMGLIARRVPPLAIVEHRGRRSGRAYRTPVMAFPTGDGFVVALTYGVERDWVRNVRAGGGGVLVRGGRGIPFSDPRLLDRDGLRLVPRPVRPVLRLIGVTAFLLLRSDDRHGDGIESGDIAAEGS